jgi:NADH-quinone oxidoreductase subunit K
MLTTVYSDFFTGILYVFTIGLFGLLFCGRHLLVILICFELMLLSIATLFIIFSLIGHTVYGQLIPLIILCLAGADSAFGLALFLITFKQYGTINLNNVENLRH